MSSTRERLLWLALGLTLLRLWVLPLHSSFWLDETLVASSVRDGVGDFIATWDVRYQSIAFVLFEWLVSLLIGSSEIALRLPSVVAAVLSLVALYWLGSRFKDREFGLICVVLFASLPHLVIEVPNARPYALALLFSICALGSFHKPWRWAVFVVLAAYTHFLFVISMVLQAALIVWRERVRRPKALVPIAVAFGCLLPLVPVLLRFSGVNRMFDYWDQPAVSQLGNYLLAGPLVAVAVLVAASVKQIDWSALRSSPVRIGLLTGVLPVVGLFLAATLFGVPVFVDRYLLVAAPGVVLLWSSIVRSIKSSALRTATLVLALVNVNAWSWEFGLVPDYRKEDWRGSASRVIPGLTLLYSGLAETTTHEWLTERRRWSHFASPLRVYRADASPENTWLIPFRNEPNDEAYVSQLLGRAQKEQRITVVARSFMHGRFWMEWTKVQLEARGYVLKSFYSHGRVAVAVFERPS